MKNQAEFSSRASPERGKHSVPPLVEDAIPGKRGRAALAPFLTVLPFFSVDVP